VNCELLQRRSELILLLVRYQIVRVPLFLCINYIVIFAFETGTQKEVFGKMFRHESNELRRQFRILQNDKHLMHIGHTLSILKSWRLQRSVGLREMYAQTKNIRDFGGETL
jgi:hypothetical protein